MPPAKTPNEPAEPLHEVPEVAGRAARDAAASQEQMRESSEALIEANRSTLETLTERSHRGDRAERREVAGDAQEPLGTARRGGPPPPTTQINEGTASAAASSWCSPTTRFGRCSAGHPASGLAGAAVGVHGRPGQRRRPARRTAATRSRSCSPAPFAAVEDGWTLVVITTAGQTLYAPLSPRRAVPVKVQSICAPTSTSAAWRSGTHDDDPLYLGVGPATQTHNARQTHATPDRRGGRARRAVHRRGSTTRRTTTESAHPLANSTQGSGDQPCFARWPAYSTTRPSPTRTPRYSDQVFRIHPYQLSQWLEQVWDFAGDCDVRQPPQPTAVPRRCWESSRLWPCRRRPRTRSTTSCARASGPGRRARRWIRFESFPGPAENPVAAPALGAPDLRLPDREHRRDRDPRRGGPPVRGRRDARDPEPRHAAVAAGDRGAVLPRPAAVPRDRADEPEFVRTCG